MRCLIPLLLVTAACNFDFEKQSHVSKLRVLAVRADPPQVVLVPGQPVPTVELTALAVGRGGEPVEVEFSLCKTVGLPAADLDCPGADGISLPATSSTSALLDLNHLEVPGDLPEVIPLAIGFEAASGGQRLHGFAAYDVRTSADTSPARNPAIQALECDGARVPENGNGWVHAGTTVSLKPLSDSSDVTFSFYSTAGEIDSLRATAKDPAVDWKAPAEPGPVQLWIVARDGRGGVGWLARTVQVVP